jgi:hypothetical protein
MSSVIVRFDLRVKASNRDANVQIAKYDMPHVPAVGSIIGLHGDPFVVHSVGYAVGREVYDAGHRADRTYAYVEVVPAGLNVAITWSEKIRKHVSGLLPDGFSSEG